VRPFDPVGEFFKPFVTGPNRILIFHRGGPRCWRQRLQHVTGAATCVQRMQKALTQMNIQLANVISDLSGVTGLAPRCSESAKHAQFSKAPLGWKSTRTGPKQV
jgi:hypothetical protein